MHSRYLTDKFLIRSAPHLRSYLAGNAVEVEFFKALRKRIFSGAIVNIRGSLHGSVIVTSQPKSQANPVLCHSLFICEATLRKQREQPQRFYYREKSMAHKSLARRILRLAHKR